MNTNTSTASAPRRTQKVVLEIKNWIVEQNLMPGDRLPGEKDLIEMFDVSKGTIREAMRILEAQGLTQTKSGPGGGCFVSEERAAVALEVLGNYFYFQPTTMADVYQLRKILEPELAATSIQYLQEEDIESTREIMKDYSLPARNKDELFEQHIRSLDFYDVYVKKCPNQILGFYCQFLHTILKKLTVINLQHLSLDDALRQKGFDYQLKLLAAMQQQDADSTRSLIYEHMCFLHQYMEKHEAQINKQFLKI